MAPLYLDSSALVRVWEPGLPGEPEISAALDPSSGHLILLSRLTPTEVASALDRKARQGEISPGLREDLWRLFLADSARRYRIQAVDEETFTLAEGLLFRHPLRAADALQLAGALRVRVALPELAADLEFWTADERQAAAAEAEGLHAACFPGVS